MRRPFAAFVVCLSLLIASAVLVLGQDVPTQAPPTLESATDVPPATDIATLVPTDVPTNTPEPSATELPSATPTGTETTTETETPTLFPTATETPSPLETALASVTATATGTATSAVELTAETTVDAGTFTATETQTATLTVTGSQTITPTGTLTNVFTPTLFPTDDPDTWVDIEPTPGVQDLSEFTNAYTQQPIFIESDIQALSTGTCPNASYITDTFAIVRPPPGGSANATDFMVALDRANRIRPAAGYNIYLCSGDYPIDRTLGFFTATNVYGRGVGSGASIFRYNANPSTVGGMFTVNGVTNVTFRNVIFRGGRAFDTAGGATRGGAVKVYDQGTLNVQDSLFDDNDASRFGGALSSISGVINVSRMMFINNGSDQVGGAIYSNNVTIDCARFRANSAIQQGGAIYTTNTSGRISNSSFLDTNSAGAGRHIYASGGNQPLLNARGNNWQPFMLTVPTWVTFNVDTNNPIADLTAAYDSGNYTGATAPCAMQAPANIPAVPAPNPRLVIDGPADNATVSSPFTIQGWSFDGSAGTGNGSGIQQMTLFAGTSCTGSPLTTVVPSVPRSDVQSAFGLDSSYANTGFSITIAPPTTGNYTYTLCARSVLSDVFGVFVTRTVNIGRTQMNIDGPSPGQTVSNGFRVQGWAFNTGVGVNSGPGISAVHVFSGSACGTNNSVNRLNNYEGSVSTLTVPRPDVRDAFTLDNSYTNSGFDIPVMLPTGNNQPFTVCIKRPNDTADGVYGAFITRQVNVTSLRLITIDAPANGATFNDTSPIAVVGWAVDASGGPRTGSGVSVVVVYPGNICSGTPLTSVSSSTFVDRAGVPTIFSLDNTFRRSGFNLSFTPPAGTNGTFNFTVCGIGGAGGSVVVQTTRSVSIAPSLSSYGINLLSDGPTGTTGAWNATEQANILAGANRIADAFTRLGVIGATSTDKFKTVMGTTVTFLRLASTPPSNTPYGVYYTTTNGYCRTWDPNAVINNIVVACRGSLLPSPAWNTNGLLSQEGAIHELGHALDIRASTQFRQYVGGNLFLADCNGERVMGTVSLGSWVRGERGWGSVSPLTGTGQQLSQFQQNPDDTNVEATADMFLNWVYRRTTDAAPTGISNDFDPIINANPAPAAACAYAQSNGWSGFQNIDRNGGSDGSKPGNVRYWWTEGTLIRLFRDRGWR